MQQVMQGIAAQLWPMVASALVVALVLGIAVARVRSRVVRQVAAYASMVVWLGWMANHYKVV